MKPDVGGADAGIPLVSVVTPIYNTASYLAECIESVLAQTCKRFEYVVADNCSTDGSLEIAKHYSARDQRIRVISNSEHLPATDNFNRALGFISRESRYTKLVLADDWLYPECLERMVGVADAAGSIGLVSSYTLTRDRVWGVGLPYNVSVFSGREVGRRQLLDEGFFVGSPSTVLYRSDLVRARPAFFDRESRHPDTEVAYEILRTHDMGFVHQVLSYIRIDPGSTSGRVRDLNPLLLDRLIALLKYGPDFLEPEEFRRRLRHIERMYYRTYVTQFLGLNRSRFLEYHRPALKRLGYRFSKPLMFRAALEEAADCVLNPKKRIARLRTSLGSRTDKSPR
ncbi:MAG TPA: glycosyltransferase family 2 protein [Candidatus Nitrosotalea sp.]|jgi:glycosyltransferase involved in cell wall biosynthesis|nr:glycosyltransferase family 2 protein [Candidatus Nitrosotalea sp.]